MTASSYDNQVHLYCCDASTFAHDVQLDGLRELLSAEELARLDSFRFERDRDSYLVSHAMLRVALSEHKDVHPSAWRFDVEEHGKPGIAGENPGLEFNLSHTHGMCVAVVAGGMRCGVDVEYMQRENDLQGVARKMFTAEEVEYMNADSKLSRQRFFQLWTLRESYLKTTGAGFSGNSDAFYFELDEDGMNAAINFTNAVEGSSVDWVFRLLRPGEEHMLAVCVQGTRDIEVVNRQIDLHAWL